MLPWTYRKKPGQPAPNLQGAFPKPLKSHQVVGFLPYWEVGGFSPDYGSLTTLVYWSSARLPRVRSCTAARATRLLRAASSALTSPRRMPPETVSCSPSFPKARSVIKFRFQASNLSGGLALAKSLTPPLRAGALDGVDLDIEGDSTADRLLL